jgi:hypothetical protein
LWYNILRNIQHSAGSLLSVATEQKNARYYKITSSAIPFIFITSDMYCIFLFKGFKAANYTQQSSS